MVGLGVGVVVGLVDLGDRNALLKYTLPCFLVGIAVSKLRMATRSTINLRLIDAMMVSITGSSPSVVGL